MLTIKLGLFLMRLKDIKIFSQIKDKYQFLDKTKNNCYVFCND